MEETGVNTQNSTESTNNEAMSNPTSAPALDQSVFGHNPTPPDTHDVDSEILNNIISAQDQDDKAILDEAPEIDNSLLEEVEVPQSIIGIFLKVLFGVLVLLSLMSYLFFKSQLTTSFDFIKFGSFKIPNISNDLALTNQEIVKLKTDLNFYRYILSKLYLDSFSYYGDMYTQKYQMAFSQTASTKEKQDAVSMIEKLKENLIISFNESRDKAAFPVHEKLIQNVENDAIWESELEVKFKEELTSAIKQKAEELKDAEDESSKREYKTYMNALKIIGNQPLRDLLLNTDIEALTDREIYILVKDVNKLIVNDLSIIQQIKDQRIKWSDIIDEIDRRTLTVDSYYSKNRYDEFGGIKYLSYDFDKEAKKIDIKGEIKRYDTVNFTMLINLIDELNSSKIFGDAEMKSFRKQGSVDSGYTTSLSLTLKLKDYIAESQDENENIFKEEKTEPVAEPVIPETFASGDTNEQSRVPAETPSEEPLTNPQP